MNTLKSVNYQYNGYPHGYKEGINIIFIQGSRHEYQTIRINGCSFTSLILWQTNYYCLKDIKKYKGCLYTHVYISCMCHSFY